VIPLDERWQIATVRHGETDYNRENRYAGTVDVALNENGRSDARAASARIKPMRFDVCISSPYKRATETAQILTGGSVEIVACDYARERNYGVLQGRTSAEVEQVRPPIHFIKIGGDYHSIDPPGAETFEELRERANMTLQDILDHHMGKKVLLVSHGVFLQQFHGALRGVDWIEALGFHVGNLELTVFNFRGESVVSEDRVRLVDRGQSDF